jgi:glycosyltransferase involved in cell wall biosynthesis
MSRGGADLVPSVVHVIVTENFAGAERYVCDVATETAARGWRVTVVGGESGRMRTELGEGVRWLPGGTPRRALAAMARAGRHDVCHVHMTLAEAVGAVACRLQGGLLVATRHFAAARGASRAGRLLAPWLSRSVDRQIAISRYVDAALESPADVVLLNGTAPAPLAWSARNRRVLVLQRLEAEKQTELALEAWRQCGLAAQGWTLRICGRGAQQATLRRQAERWQLAGVEFAGHTTDVAAEFAAAGMLLATAPAEPLGLSVIEAMAAGVPVVAAAGGGHAETIGVVPGAMLFTPGDAAGAADALRALAQDDPRRTRLSEASHAHHRQLLTRAGHVGDLISCYRSWLDTKCEEVVALGIARIPARRAS